MIENSFSSRVCEIDIPLFLLNINSLEIIDLNLSFAKVVGFSTKQELLLDDTFSIVSFLKTSEIILKIKNQKRAVNEKVECIGYDGVPFYAIISAQQTEVEDVYQIIVLEISKNSGSEKNVIDLLPNNNYMERKISEEIARSKIDGSKIAFISLDIDHFKKVNDVLGSRNGDKMIELFSKRLSEHLGENDYLAHKSGDKFSILYAGLNDLSGISKKLTEIVNNFKKGFNLYNMNFHYTVSAGAAFFPDDASNPEQLYDNSQTALNNAKTLGGNRFIFYSRDMNIDAYKNIELENSIHKAVKNSEFKLLYQPIFDLNTGKIKSMEALIRWQNPDTKACQPPSKFIPFCEKSGLIIQVGKWVLKTACLQNKTWQEQGLEKVPVSINLSAVQFKDKNLISTVQETLKDTGLDPKYLEIEVTETSLIDNFSKAVETVSQLKSLGVSISIDDFGTGYSSLIYLKKFNVDKLKIDRSFINELPKSTEDAAIVSAVLGLCRSLNLQTVAEGVETKEQEAFLKSRNCDTVQGYYYSKPIPSSKIREFLKK